MTQRTMAVGIGLALALATTLTGCAGRAKITTKTMCEAHGGTYSAQAKQCTYPAQSSTRSAAQICQMQGGELDPVADTCSIDDRSR